MGTDHDEEFVGEALTPMAGTGDPAQMARGEPGLPGAFTWRETTYRVVEVLRQWKSSGPCHSGSTERYLRRHWYRVRTDPMLVMTLYCQRQPQRGSNPKNRWFVYTIEPDE